MNELLENLAMQGGAIKALGETEANGRPAGKLGGVLCLFSGPEDPDQTKQRDYFDASTDFRFVPGMKSPVYYHHGLDRNVGVKAIGETTLIQTDRGIEHSEALIWLDDPDGVKFYADAQAGKLAWSSGTAAHLVKRTPVAVKAGVVSHHIDFWPLGLDASLTPNAAEPRNVAVAVKSLIEDVEPGEDADATKSLDDLEAGQLYGSRFVDHSSRLLAAVGEYEERVEDLTSKRALKAGRVISEANHAHISEICDALLAAAGKLKAHLGTHAPEPSDNDGMAGKSLAAEIEELEIKALMQETQLSELLQGVTL